VNSKTLKACITSNNKCKLLSMITLYFLSLNIPPITFIFSFPCHHLIKAWSSKINTAHHYKFMCPYITTWKHLTSSLWMNIAEFIFQLLHIYNIRTLSILTPFHSPFTPFADYAYLFPNYKNTTSDYINSFVDLANIIDISIDLYIPNLALLQLLFICK